MQSNPKVNKIRRIGKQTNAGSDTNNINAHAKPSNSEASSGKSRAQKPKKTSPMKKALWVLLALVIVGSAVFLKFYLDINNPAALFLEQPEPTQAAPDPTPIAAAPSSAPEITPEPTIDPEALLLSQADLELMKDRVNILVLGIDESAERSSWGSFRTDTMLLLTIDFNTNKVDMLSIPRDSYVKLANTSGKLLYEGEEVRYGKINSAFSSGGGAQKNGFGYSMGTVSYLLGGLPIHYYVGFNMTVVKEVVDAMGGVDYDVDVEVNMNGRQLLPGMQHLNGQAVLDYARQRKGSSDIARIDRQQRIVTEILKQLKQTGEIARLPEIYKALEQNIETNLSFKQISSLALFALRMDMAALGRHTVAGTALN
ncbi:MAG TPA: LCP family protein, partial [Clostridia bacterium]|nr:LCP family protein [Clostridia bacterium]